MADEMMNVGALDDMAGFSTINELVKYTSYLKQI